MILFLRPYDPSRQTSGGIVLAEEEGVNTVAGTYYRDVHVEDNAEDNLGG